MKGEESSGGPIYSPQNTGTLENFLTQMALGTAVKQNPNLGSLLGKPNTPVGQQGFGLNSIMAGRPNSPMDLFKPQKQGGGQGSGNNQAVTSMGVDLPQLDFGGLSSNIKNGTLLNGEKIPGYNPGSNYQYKAPDLSYAPQKAYGGILDKNLEGIQQDQQTAGAQANRNFGSRGLGKSGLLQGAQTTLGRQAMQNASNQRRDIGFQQAQDQLGVDKANAGYNMQTQQLQGDENYRRAQQSLSARQAMQAMQLQQIGAMGTLNSQANSQAMQPFQMLSGLYGQNIGISPGQQKQGGKGDPFSALLGAAGTIGGAYFGGPAGASLGGSLGHSLGGGLS